MPKYQQKVNTLSTRFENPIIPEITGTYLFSPAGEQDLHFDDKMCPSPLFLSNLQAVSQGQEESELIKLTFRHVSVP